MDFEHAPYDWRDAVAVVAVCAEAGCTPFIRVPDHSPTWIKRALDVGAFGIIVPMIETVEQARQVIAAAKFPPEGNRSAGGGMHNLNFDCTVEEYFTSANEQIMVVLQTESPLGVKNAPEIYALPGCDAILIGPGDLRMQMRSDDGQYPSKEDHEAMIQEIVSVGKNLGKPTGIHVLTAEQVNVRIDQGMQLIGVSSDLAMMTQKASEIARTLGLDAKSDIARY